MFNKWGESSGPEDLHPLLAPVAGGNQLALFTSANVLVVAAPFGTAELLALVFMTHAPAKALPGRSLRVWTAGRSG